MDAWDAALGGSRRRRVKGAAVMADSPSSTAATYGPHGVRLPAATVVSPSQYPAGSQPVSTPRARGASQSRRRRPRRLPRKGRRPMWIVAGVVGALLVLAAGGVAARHARARLVRAPPPRPTWAAAAAAAATAAGPFRGDRRGQPDGVGSKGAGAFHIQAQSAASAARLAETATAVGQVGRTGRGLRCDRHRTGSSLRRRRRTARPRRPQPRWPMRRRQRPGARCGRKHRHGRGGGSDRCRTPRRRRRRPRSAADRGPGSSR